MSTIVSVRPTFQSSPATRLDVFPHAPGVLSDEYSKLRSATREILSSYFANSRGDVCLDLGCGAGELSATVAAAFDNYIGIDTDSRALRRFAKRSPSATASLINARIEDCNFRMLPAADLLLMSHVYYYFSFDSWPELTDMIARQIAPGGYLMVVLWSEASENYGYFLAESARNCERLCAEGFLSSCCSALDIIHTKTVDATHWVHDAYDLQYKRFLRLETISHDRLVNSHPVYGIECSPHHHAYRQTDVLILLRKPM